MAQMNPTWQMGSRLTLDRRLISSKRDRRHLGGEPNIHGHLVSGLPPRAPDRAGTLAMYALFGQHPALARARQQSRLKAERRLHAPFAVPPGAFATACCTSRRLFAVLEGAFSNSCCTSRRFSAVLARAFCCTCTRLWARQRRPRIHPRKRKQAREEHGSPESSRPWRAASRRPTSRPVLAGRTQGSQPRPTRSVSIRPGRDPAPADLR